ncbi:putative acetoin dehydrogenase [Tieghemostelium lacteum]|uniref:Putative acetoin dehydrogenase n=1 Tax=Tieghemostelium lacteum TaxID=361077 RepID=A0A152A7M9_TIELA|nr:putative acetoin dehydrogenase [Tieghemostelium lacteum]|eukprot:KYR02239.1 putative acetoin dehydrogenase [Tieghemostelium lacteum]
MSLLVKQLMSKQVQSISIDATLDSALKALNMNSIHRLPVVDKNLNLVGIITDRDLRLACDSPFLDETNQERMEKLKNHTVQSIMKHNPITIEDNSLVVDACKLMRVSNVGGLPVTNREGKLCGIITRSDLLDLVIRLLEPVPPQN